MARLTVLAVFTATLLAACTSSHTTSPPRTTIRDGRSVLTIWYGTCNGDCPAGVMVGDVFVAASNAYLKPQFTNGAVVAVGTAVGVPDEARRLPGVTSPWLLAVHKDGTWSVYYGLDNAHLPTRSDMEKVFAMVCDTAGLPYSTVAIPPGTQPTPCTS